jgi:hypothetical protein
VWCGDVAFFIWLVVGFVIWLVVGFVIARRRLEPWADLYSIGQIISLKLAIEFFALRLLSPL